MEFLSTLLVAYGGVGVWMRLRASLFLRDRDDGTTPTVTCRVTETHRLNDSVEILDHENVDSHSSSVYEFLNSPFQQQQMASRVLSQVSTQVDEYALPYWHGLFSSFLSSAVALAVSTPVGSHHPNGKMRLVLEVKLYREGLELHDVLVLDRLLHGDINGHQPPSGEGFDSVPPPPPPPTTPNSVLGNLERVKYDPSADRFGQQGCPICFEEFQTEGAEVARMPCSHLFHCHCIAKWLERS